MLAVGTGLEPATPCVTGTYSNQLNYPTDSHRYVNNALASFSFKAVAKVISFSNFPSVP